MAVQAIPAESFEVRVRSVHRINICAKRPAQRQTATLKATLINMKQLIFLIAFSSCQFLFISNSNCQKLDSMIHTLELPKNWTASIAVDTTYWKIFDTNLFAQVTFSDSKHLVIYYVFEYNETDSLKFRNGLSAWYMFQNCNFKRNQDLGKELPSFAKQRFYFLLQACPCRTIENPECAKLALSINKWIQ